MDKPRLLIVEDDFDLAEMLTAYFGVQHYEVVTASNGEDALKLAQEKVFDLVMLDIHLPDIDGHEVCRRLRDQRRTQDVPIIFLTGQRDRTNRLQGLELGVVDYITKPFDIQELRLRIRNAITRASRQALVNPVTDLPETSAVEKKLATLLDQDSPWTVLQISIPNLSEFQEKYGFIAADDVLRAVALMIRNAVREYGNSGDYIGHLGTENFVIITEKEKVEAVRQRIENRIVQSREYFYPMKDREKAREAMDANHLNITSSVVHQPSAPFADLDALKKAMADAVTEIKARSSDEKPAEDKVAEEPTQPATKPKKKPEAKMVEEKTDPAPKSTEKPVTTVEAEVKPAKEEAQPASKPGEELTAAPSAETDKDEAE